MSETIQYNEKQLQIMEVALRLFAEHGYDKTSIRDIARKAEVNVAMVSYYFGSKEKLLEAVFINHFNSIRSILRTIINQRDNSATDKVSQIIDVFIDMLASRQLFHRLMIRESGILKQGPLFDMIKEMKTVNRRLVEKAVRNGQRLGVFRHDVDVFFMSSVLIGSVNQNMANTRYELEHSNMTDEQKEAAMRARTETLRRHLKQMFIAYLTDAGNH
ncbi:TetR/AcrR family transcriptional regulator [Parapedobacter koreensis]|uniref:Transcriptional regulator, TetR family n=1 Tax=Parapedobacter koreensis TaxID=332977 RepID=A0A1H7HXR6_9SPHI|nr:TetR family transcriptional regulator [Parapedobacter koreensis]SEK55049.1 transcriptional regulator, TetR family [Parapedobacter koreensis]